VSFIIFKQQTNVQAYQCVGGSGVSEQQDYIPTADLEMWTYSH